MERRLIVTTPLRGFAGVLIAASLLATAACDRRADTGAVVVSAIGGQPRLADPSRTVLDTPARLLLDSTAQGLVRFDAAGQIEPGLAERWIVTDGGLRYIFRLREGQWADGTPVTAEQVVAILMRQVAPASRNPLTPFLTAIDEIVVMTPQVIEVRLGRPRPDLLKLFAQPELALLRMKRSSGSGPFRVARQGTAPLLRPAFDPAQADPDDHRETKPEDDVRLIGERAARAIARFTNRDSDLVSGGSFVDWPLLATTDVVPTAIRIDPAVGLFGLAIVSRDGFLAAPANRAAVAQAIDRTALTGAIATNWRSPNARRRRRGRWPAGPRGPSGFGSRCHRAPARPSSMLISRRHCCGSASCPNGCPQTLRPSWR
jgi:peptide/nickel transport system substrate-binding protein